MHIHGWDKGFLSQLDAKEYVRQLRASNTQSALVYAQSHVGYCNWPTETGTVHPNLAHRDFIGDMVNECRSHDMDIMLYYSLVFNTVEAENHPDWRTVDANGETIYGLRNPRYGACCPNNMAYRDFTVSQIKELGQRYDVDGFWFDMTFWPDICACPACRERYDREIGGEFPTTVDWRDPKWVTFQRARERWMADFGQLATDTARAARPGVSVAHQSGMFLTDWKLCGSVELADASDYMSADLYGDVVRHSISSKVFYNLSNQLPFEYMTSRCPNLLFHTTTKSEAMLREQAMSAVANGGGFLFIDAIDPIGTLDEHVYRRMRSSFDEIERLEGKLGGRLRQEVAIYLSMESRVPIDEKQPVAGGNTAFTFEAIYGGNPPPHLKGLYEYSGYCVRNHIPFGIITRKNLSMLPECNVLILPDVQYLSDHEIEEFTRFVSNGGTLVVSGEVGTMDLDGRPREGGGLANVIGCRLTGATDESVTYIRPAEGLAGLFEPYGTRNPINVMGPQTTCAIESGAEVLGYTTLPYTSPGDWKRFASIHSNPPGRDTDNPAVVVNRFGNGSAVYLSATIELEFYAHLLTNLLKRANGTDASVQTNAPDCVEVTVFDDEGNDRILVHAVNYGTAHPRVPVRDIEVRVRHDFGPATTVTNVAGGAPARVTGESSTSVLHIDELDLYQVHEIKRGGK